MAKKQESVLGLSAAGTDYSFGTAGSLVPVSPGQKLTREQQGILDTAYTQRLAIEAYHAKALFASSKLAGIQQGTMSNLDETASVIVGIRERAGRSPFHQAVINEFSDALIKTVAEQDIGLLQVSGYRIAEEAHKSVYADLPHGFWTRLLGR